MRLKRQESKYMQQFNIDRYFNLLRLKGYEVKPRYDKQRKLVGYTVGKNASVFKASEIGRKFMASKIEVSVYVELLHIFKSMFAILRKLHFPYIPNFLRLFPPMPHIDDFRSLHCPKVDVMHIVGVTLHIHTTAVNVKVQRSRLGIRVQSAQIH